MTSNQRTKSPAKVRKQIRTYVTVVKRPSSSGPRTYPETSDTTHDYSHHGSTTSSRACVVSSLPPPPTFLGYSCRYYVPIETRLTRRIVLNTMNVALLYFVVCLAFACAGVRSLSVYTADHVRSLLTVDDDLTTDATNRGSLNRAKRDTRSPITPSPSNGSDGNITSKVSTSFPSLLNVHDYKID